MFINFSSLQNQQVLSLELKMPVARIVDVVINPGDGKLLGFLVKKNIFAQKQLITTLDILSIFKNTIIISSEDRIIEPREVIKIQTILKNKIRVFRNWAETRSQKMLGRIDDLMIDSNSFEILKIYINGSACKFCLLGFLKTRDDRIISKSDIYKITRRAVIVKNDVLKNQLKISAFAKKEEEKLIAAESV